jgi:uncharacterized protein
MPGIACQELISGYSNLVSQEGITGETENRCFESSVMTLFLALSYIVLGILSGFLSGLIGIGGGTIIVPVLILIFGLSQKTAQGTTLALLVPPIGILAAWTYYKQGYVDFPIAGLICVGFLLGGLIGAKLATNISNQTLERIFGIALLIISIKMIFSK